MRTIVLRCIGVALFFGTLLSACGQSAEPALTVEQRQATIIAEITPQLRPPTATP